jgi:prophage regulatory protein
MLILYIFPQMVSNVLTTLTEEFCMNMLTTKHQLIKRPELEQLIGLSRSSIYDRLNPKSKRYDATFPKAIKLSHSTRWRLSEVLDWIESKAALRNQHDLVS